LQPSRRRQNSRFQLERVYNETDPNAIFQTKSRRKSFLLIQGSYKQHRRLYMSKKWLIALIIAVLIVVLYAYVEKKFPQQAGFPTTPISDQNPKFNLHREKDRTDTYAIQLDSSESEQNSELKQLETGVKK